MKALSPLVQWPLVVAGQGLVLEMLSHTRGALAGWPAVRECVFCLPLQLQPVTKHHLMQLRKASILLCDWLGGTAECTANVFYL